jgi:Fic family protein
MQIYNIFWFYTKLSTGTLCLTFAIFVVYLRTKQKEMNSILFCLVEEKRLGRKGGLYHKTQVNLAYNSNRIEGSRLTEEQTRYIFETRTIGFKEEEAVPVDDIIETSNHFVALDYLIDTIDTPLSNELIRTLHRILKTGTADAAKSWFPVGDWKKLPNEVGGSATTLPRDVEKEMNQLNDWYLHTTIFSLDKIIEYHYRFEKIHPFQDGNGRVGRLIMFRECLKNKITPFIIDERHKQFYYRGLKEFTSTPGYLTDTCLSAQDTYTEWVKYFYPDGGFSFPAGLDV